jgi:hypothetical protein
MKTFQALLLVAASFALSEAAISEENVTVQSLVKRQFAVVSAIASPIGPGLFLQKGNQLFLCFVVETPQSATIVTRYCKPVR